ncbi:Nuclear pore complex nucleoporin component [Apophysomyces ossiformis]|uniref:mRNA export factor GLE1 n=1 Tax=Apophysomyces ossiformis TaxID=679940 RepID=A0A8H7ES78_9FUNG|nr:Nuclear pore complex nucleoporin component [Apophysomyces ossiformis]
MEKPKFRNPVSYSAPFDSDSESDSDDALETQWPTPRPVPEEQRRRLARLVLEQRSPYDAYKETIKHISIAPITDAILRRHQEYRLEILRRKKAWQEERQRTIEKKTQQAEIIAANAALVLMDEQESLDNEVERRIKDQEKRIQAAIELARKVQQERATEEKAKAEKEKKEKERKEEEIRRQEAAEKERKERLSQSIATSAKGLEEYKEYFATIENFRANIKPLLKEPGFRKQCFEARRLIKRTIIQLQYKHEVIFEKYCILRDHLLNTKNQSMEAFHVMLNHTAKVFLLQARQEINATPFAAYFLGRFATLLCSSIPELSNYLIARLFKWCPYLIPQYHDDNPNLSHDEIRKLLRYEYDEDNKTFEPFLPYLERQKCFVMFFAALIQTVPDPGQPPNPFSISKGWIWLARTCNMPPREVSPALIQSFLEIAGKRMLQTYPHQFPKLLRVILGHIVPAIPLQHNHDNKADIARLEIYLKTFFETGELKSIPEAIEPKVK